MLYFLEEFLEFAIPVLIFCAVIYGAILLVKLVCKKIVEVITGNADGKLTYKQKKKVLNVIKILAGAQVVGFVFYCTPVINENIKILLSMLITIGSLVGAFFIEDKKTSNTISRTLVFIGQEFFGITMILLMVNKGSGYTAFNIFAIWSVFNFGVYKIFNKKENKFFLLGTLFGCISTGLVNYVSEIELYMAVILTIVGLLAIYFFGNKKNKLIDVMHSVGLTIFSILLFGAVSNQVDKLGVIYMAGLIYTLTILVSKIKLQEFKSLKALLVYIPYVAIILLSNLSIEVLYILILFNALSVIWMVAEKSLYKKVLCVVMTLLTMFFANQYINIDETMGVLIYIGTTIFVFTYLFAPEKQEALEEGGVSDEE